MKCVLNKSAVLVWRVLNNRHLMAHMRGPLGSLGFYCHGPGHENGGSTSEDVTLTFSILPTSNSKPWFSKVWQHPPAWSCCSRTRTLFPALASTAAADRPPMPLPMTTASRRSGMRSLRKPLWKQCDVEISSFSQQSARLTWGLEC